MRTRAVDNGPADGWRGARIGAELRDRARRRSSGIAAEIDIGEPGTPRVTVGFLALMLLVTVWEFSMYGASPSVSELARAGGTSVGAVANGEWWKLLAANALHGNVPHLIMNAFVIYLTGRWLEHLVGRALMLATVLWSGLLASVGSIYVDTASVTIGASGVAFGILGCAVAVDPRGRTAAGQIARLLALVNVVLTFLVPGIAIGGHLGGLVAGLLVGWLGWDRSRTAAAPAGAPRRVTTYVSLAVAVPLVALLAIGPAPWPDDAVALRGAVVAPLLERQVEGIELTSGAEVESARCRGTADPAVYRCNVDGAPGTVRFSSRDDQWSLGIPAG